MKMTFREIKNRCDDKMKVGDNVECAINRRVISGLGGCLCKKDNCPKVEQPQPIKTER